jgi:hypothetical protein
MPAHHVARLGRLENRLRPATLSPAGRNTENANHTCAARPSCVVVLPRGRFYAGAYMIGFAFVLGAVCGALAMLMAGVLDGDGQAEEPRGR